MVLNVQKGNLFDLDNRKYIYAHCISLDCKMGAGIATTFDKDFPGMKSYIKRVVSENRLNYPCVVPYFNNDKRVYNLITKEKYWQKPTIESMEAVIRELAFMCDNNHTNYLAIPKIGCGLDRLSWPKVRELIEKYFYGMDIRIEVRYLWIIK